MQVQEKPPLILTLKLDEKSQAFFDHQRWLFFPPNRNFLKAHLTLFHQLPDDRFSYDILKKLDYQLFDLRVTGLMNLAAGVAYMIGSPELKTLHQKLSGIFKDFFIPQDRQPFRPHITIQNKVAPETAKQLLKNLSEDFKEFKILGTGLQLWRYLNGPWEFVQTFDC